MTENSDEIEMAFHQLEFAIRFLSYCELGKLDLFEFDLPHMVSFDRDSLHFPTGHFSKIENVIVAANVGVLLAFSATALVLDQAFEAKGIDPNPDATDTIGQIRTLIYMIRNAHAHRIAAPHWKVKSKYRRVFHFETCAIRAQVNLGALDGHHFDIAQIGGYPAWYAIRDFVLENF